MAVWLKINKILWELLSDTDNGFLIFGKVFVGKFLVILDLY